MTEISKEYAAALFSLAEENGGTASYREALGLLLDEWEQNPEYEALLSSPSIPIRERREIIEAAFADRVPEHVLSFFEILCEKGHIALFPACVKEYEDLWRRASGESVARIVSAVPLTEEEKDTLCRRLTAKVGHKVVAHYETDPTLLGGVTVYLDDTVIDGSLRRKLKEVKEVLGK